MFEHNIFHNSYLILAFAAFIVNIPLGFFRQNCPKYSLKWLFWIHASIPLIIYIRISLGTSLLFIPICIFLAVIGQIYGGRWKNRKMTLNDTENHQQIPFINESNSSYILDSDIMVALLNMGGPKTNNDVPEFQMRLFSDSRLIRFPLSWALQKLFATLLVTFRSKASKKRYQLIGGGSPIFNSTQNQTTALQKELNQRGREIKVTFSFNYSSPFPQETIKEVKNAHKKYLMPLSLYPHYSSATTGSNLYHLKKSAKNNYSQMKFLSTANYHLHDGYINAFVDRINDQIQSFESLDDFYILFSAHGLPLYPLQ